MNTKEPLVSIVIPVYNGADYVAKAIDSALAQSYTNIEILVINDGSKDKGETEKIVTAYGDKIKYVKKENGGVSSALNVGLQMMNGKYFSWLSHDDEYAPDKISKQVELLLKHSDEKLIALCGTSFINEQSQLLSKEWVMPKDGIYSPEQALSSIIRKSLSGISLLIPKNAFEQCGLFDETLRYTQDKNMWARMFLNDYGLIVESTLLAKSRLHGAQQTNTHRERFKEEMERTAFDFSKRYFDHGYYDLVRSQWYSLLKNDICQAAKQTEQLLKQAGLLNLKTRIKGCIYGSYGKIRPLIRFVYYKIKFGISSKG